MLEGPSFMFWKLFVAQESVICSLSGVLPCCVHHLHICKFASLHLHICTSYTYILSLFFSFFQERGCRSTTKRIRLAHVRHVETCRVLHETPDLHTVLEQQT